jgi:hypothetical protein
LEAGRDRDYVVFIPIWMALTSSSTGGSTLPKALHDKLERQARKKGFKGKRADRYVYGTMNKIKKKKKKKGYSDGGFVGDGIASSGWTRGTFR